jgi:2-dehydropantoate 2-reductase
VKIGIFGAGAIGGYLAVKLHLMGASVTVIARGSHLAAIRENGLTLRSESKTTTVNLFCTDDVSTVEPQDYVFVTLKAHSLGSAAEQIARLMSADTALVMAINGIPYWYFYGADTPWRDRPIESVDPGGRLWNVIHPRRTIGCVVYPAAEVVRPGLINHTYGESFILGEPDGSDSARVRALSSLLKRAGLQAPIRSDIRHDVWMKLSGNLAFNPISALTSATLDRLALQPDLRAITRVMMQEAVVVAGALGIHLPIDVDKQIDRAAELGAHKTSMLQDLERGRPLEIDALLGAVVELAQLTGQPTPLCQAILALVRERARRAGCYPPIL